MSRASKRKLELTCIGDGDGPSSTPPEKQFKPVLTESGTTGFDQLLELAQGSSSPDNEISNETIIQRLGSLDLFPTTQPFECPVCLTEIEIGQGVILRDCLHTFCRGCLSATIRHSEDATVKCPFQDGNYSCTSCLAPREIKALLPPEAHEDFTNRSVRLAELGIPNTFHCKTPDCQGWCETNENSRFFLCPICDKVNCLSCKAIHETDTCVEFQKTSYLSVRKQDERLGEETIERGIKSKTYARCPKCKMVCQKVSGCNHVICGACKRRFTWKGKTVADDQIPPYASPYGNIHQPIQRAPRRPRIRGRHAEAQHVLRQQNMENRRAEREVQRAAREVERADRERQRADRRREVNAARELARNNRTHARELARNNRVDARERSQAARARANEARDRARTVRENARAAQVQAVRERRNRRS